MGQKQNTGKNHRRSGKLRKKHMEKWRTTRIFEDFQTQSSFEAHILSIWRSACLKWSCRRVEDSHMTRDPCQIVRYSRSEAFGPCSGTLTSNSHMIGEKNKQIVQEGIGKILRMWTPVAKNAGFSKSSYTKRLFSPMPLSHSRLSRWRPSKPILRGRLGFRFLETLGHFSKQRDSPAPYLPESVWISKALSQKL